MRIIRARHPDAINFMKPFYSNMEDYEDGVFDTFVETLMQNMPDYTFILQAYDGDEIISFLIAYAPVGQRHVFVVQAWTKEDNKDLTRSMFSKLCIWTEYIGRKEIRMNTYREPSVWTRAYKFETFSTVMAYKIPEYDEELEDVGRRRSINGSSINTDKKPESNRGGDVKVVKGEAGKET